jgi:putative hydrolase of the HAD superfamily
VDFKAVIFDLFGTLVPSGRRDPYIASLRRSAELAGADADRFIEFWTDRSFVDHRMKGTFPSQVDYVRHVCTQLGVTPDDGAVEAAAEERTEFERLLLEPRTDAVTTLTHLKAAGLKLALMTSCPPQTPALWEETPFTPLFDVALFSSKLGLNKPDPRFYQLACERLGVPAGRCAYIGDGANCELDGARDAGMHPVLICPPAEAEIILARAGVREWDGPRVQSLSEVPGLLGVDGEGGA